MRRCWVLSAVAVMVGPMAPAPGWSAPTSVTVPSSGTSASVANVPWLQVAPGVQRFEPVEDPAKLLLWAFDLTMFRADMVIGGADHRATAEATRTTLDAVAAVNGGFFDEHWRPLGLRIAGGETRVKLRSADWGVLLLTPGHARIVHSRDYRPDASISGALQVGPRLVVDGKPLHLKPQLARRTGVAVDRGGQWLTMFVTREEVAAQQLADRLAAWGYDAAIMLDGGPSTQLSAALGTFRDEVRGAYAVPDLLVIRRGSPARAGSSH